MVRSSQGISSGPSQKAPLKEAIAEGCPHTMSSLAAGGSLTVAYHSPLLEAASLNDDGQSTVTFAPDSEQVGEDVNMQLAERHYISYDMVLQARRMFNYYRTVDEAVSLEAARRAQNVTIGQVALSLTTRSFPRTEASFVDDNIPRGSDCQSSMAHIPLSGRLDSDARTGTLSVASIPMGEAVVAVAGLQAFFKDLGIAKSSLDIADIIQDMAGRPRDLEVFMEQQSHEVQKEDEKQRASGPLGASPGLKKREKGVTAASQVSSSSLSTSIPHTASVEQPRLRIPSMTVPPPCGLNFDLFLSLLQQRLSVAEESASSLNQEAQEVFHALDRDGNGILTDTDIRQCLNTLMIEEGVLAGNRDMLQLASLHPVELRTALEECDVDGDGEVTVSDFVTLQRYPFFENDTGDCCGGRR